MTRFTGNYWTECQVLMRQVFGRPEPSILQATTVNPRAVAAFLAWNTQLLPGGLQVSLFGASAFENDPGSVPVTENSTYALLLSVVMLLLVIAGLTSAVREGKISVRRMSPQTLWIALTLASISVATVLVVLTTRPWSEYAYGLTVSAMVLTGVAVLTLMRRVGGSHILAPLALLTVAGLIVGLTSMYSRGPRPVYEGVKHLGIAQKQLQRPGSVLVAGENESHSATTWPTPISASAPPSAGGALQAQVTPQRSAAQVLDSVHATALYVDAKMLAEPAIAMLVAAPRTQGWQRIAYGSGPDGPWRVLVRAGQPS